MADRQAVLKKAIATAVLAGASALGAILGYEGLSNQTYVDGGGVMTNCVGHTGKDVKRGAVASDSVCATLLAKDADEAAGVVRKAVKIDLSQGELDAYTSFVYNVGAGQFQSSTLLKLVNQGYRKEACGQLLRWVYDNGKVVQGLKNRRASEYTMCMAGVTSGYPVPKAK